MSCFLSCFRFVTRVAADFDADEVFFAAAFFGVIFFSATLITSSGPSRGPLRGSDEPDADPRAGCRMCRASPIAA